MPKFEEQPFIVPKGTLSNEYTQLTDGEAAALGISSSETDTSVEHIDFTEAQELLGEDFLGPEAVARAWGVKLEKRDIPPIPFSNQDLLRAKELGQMLILRVDHSSDGKPLTMAAMNTLLAKKLEKAGKGKLLNDPSGWQKNEDFFKAETPKAAWALTSKELVPDSTDKNYLEQTQMLADYLRTEVFHGTVMPPAYQEAIREFTAQRKEIERLMTSDWKVAAKKLASLKINQITRQSPAETLYDVATVLNAKGERFLEDTWTWNNRLTSGGRLVVVGYADAGGAYVRRGEPGYSFDRLGVVFSRSQ